MYQEHLLPVKQIFPAWFYSSYRAVQKDRPLYCNYLLDCFLLTEHIPQSCSLQSKTVRVTDKRVTMRIFDWTLMKLELENTAVRVEIPALKGHTVN